MSTITLSLKEQPPVPLEAEALCPDVMAGLGNDAIRKLPVYLGKHKLPLDDFFEVEGGNADLLQINGDLRKVKWVGRGMTRGRIVVNGNVGMHLGAYMKGGVIDVSGNASDWVGGEMSNGLIRVAGNAGGQIGAAYRGSITGMSGGSIVIGGSAGMEVGMRMKKGIIAVSGAVRDFAGVQMKGGTLLLLGGAELRTGAWMLRGTIISLCPLRLLPTFSSCCDYYPPFLRIYARHLQSLGLSLPAENSGSYRRYAGDSSVPGKGEVLIWQPSAE